MDSHFRDCIKDNKLKFFVYKDKTGAVDVFVLEKTLSIFFISVWKVQYKNVNSCCFKHCEMNKKENFTFYLLKVQKLLK